MNKIFFFSIKNKGIESLQQTLNSQILKIELFLFLTEVPFNPCLRKNVIDIHLYLKSIMFDCGFLQN